MKRNDFHQAALEIRILVNIVAKMARRDLEQRLDASGIGVGALPFSVMRLLSYHPYTISELSRKMILKPATLVPAIDALERQGFQR